MTNKEVFKLLAQGRYGRVHSCPYCDSLDIFVKTVERTEDHYTATVLIDCASCKREDELLVDAHFLALLIRGYDLLKLGFHRRPDKPEPNPLLSWIRGKYRLFTVRS